MKETDKPIIDMLTLRRDLYLVMSLLLADKEMAKVPDTVDWTKYFYENEVRRLMLWIATAIRGLLDLSKEGGIEKQVCGEYWPDTFKPGSLKPLTFRQTCNSVIHAKMILNYKVPKRELDEDIKQVYENRITVKGSHRGKTTHAELDIVRFVKIANTLMNSFKENDNADRFRHL